MAGFLRSGHIWLRGYATVCVVVSGQFFFLLSVDKLNYTLSSCITHEEKKTLHTK